MKKIKLITATVLLVCMVALSCGCDLMVKVQEPLGNPEYSDKEIQELVDANLTLEEATEKISTVTDAMNYLTACGYKFDYSYNHGKTEDYDDGIAVDWVWVLSAQFTFDHMAGMCGGTSCLFNHLLKDDYEEEGYVRMDGHIFNYIKDGDKYYFCDFAGPGFQENPDMVIQDIVTDPKEFVDTYFKLEPKAYEYSTKHYCLTYMYMYESNGEDALPEGYVFGMGEKDGDNADHFYYNAVPDCAKNLIVLYEREGFHVVTRHDFPERPADVNIPNDKGKVVD